MGSVSLDWSPGGSLRNQFACHPTGVRDRGRDWGKRVFKTIRDRPQQNPVYFEPPSLILSKNCIKFDHVILENASFETVTTIDPSSLKVDQTNKTNISAPHFIKKDGFPKWKCRLFTYFVPLLLPHQDSSFRISGSFFISSIVIH